MSFSDDIFDDLLDFNGDGEITNDEEWLNYTIIDECTNDENDEDLENRDTFDEYEDYFDEYQEDSSVTIPLTIKFERRGQEELDKIKKSDYPNIRKYDAAYHLCDLKQGTAIISDYTDEQFEIEKCEFILYSDTIAAKYLTVSDGFLFAQAVKENFNLPLDIPDEDAEVKTYFDDLLMEVAEEDTKLAVEIWAWCIKEFGPYKKYMKDDWDLYNSILASIEEYPEEFIDIVINKVETDVIFCNGLFTENPRFPRNIAQFVSRALENGLIKEALLIFNAVVINPIAKSKDKTNFIESIISDCYNWEELETMEAFKFNLLPVIKDMNDKRVQRLLPKFIEKIDYYIDSVESSEEKYQYYRRFAWRKNCADGSEYGIDPLNYETEQQFNAAIQHEKYKWRGWHSEAKRYGINVEDYETEDEYLKILEAKRSEERTCRRSQVSCTDPLAKNDQNIYSFCGVIFSGSNRVYYYLTGSIDVKIGDYVIVKSRDDRKETVAKVVSTSQHKRLFAPYPVNKAKKIIGIFTPPADCVICPLCDKEISLSDCYKIVFSEYTQEVTDLIDYDEFIKNKSVCEKCEFHT